MIAARSNASKRLASVPAYPFVEWNRSCHDLESRGVDVIRLDVGNPDLAPPDSVIDILCATARDGKAHGYPGFRGKTALREAIADYYARRFNVHLDPEDQIDPLLGSKEGIIHLSLACLNPGDIALVPDPGYAPYARGARLAGATPMTFPLHANSGYLPDLGAIPADVARKARILWLNYPNNPTGACADLGFLTTAVDFAREHDIVLCHDAPYTDISFDGFKPPSVLEVPGATDVAIELNSLSKTFNMAGWRVGMALGRQDVLSQLSQLKSNIDSGMFLPLQAAAAEALRTPAEWIAQRNAIYQERFAPLVDGLRNAGLHARAPKASLYLWAKLSPGKSSAAVARALLETAGISTTPGTFFGAAGEGYLRISVTSPMDRIVTAANRLAALPENWIDSRTAN